MDISTTEQQPQEPRQEVPIHLAPYLTYLDEEIAPEVEPEEGDFLAFIRGLLVASDDDEAAVGNTVEAIRKYYSSNYLIDENAWSRQKDHGVGGIIHCISTFTFELASQVPLSDIRHQRLADLLTQLKKSAPRDFDETNPQLLFDIEPLLLVASESWNHYRVTSVVRTEAKFQKCSGWINISAFLARLLSADVTSTDGIHWATSSIEEGLETPEDDSYVDELIRRCRAAVATQYIMISGAQIAQEIKSPSREWDHPLTAKKWKIWADKLDHIARTTTCEAEWDLKNQADKAHAKIVELCSELFEEEPLSGTLLRSNWESYELMIVYLEGQAHYEVYSWYLSSANNAPFAACPRVSPDDLPDAGDAAAGRPMVRPPMKAPYKARLARETGPNRSARNTVARMLSLSDSARLLLPPNVRFIRDALAVAPELTLALYARPYWLIWNAEVLRLGRVG
ncbi:hypothetical protein G7046_g4818 [Stylonectria norvegica]|nr:hypothetical protein G7046_g4818 [Stylonectria norvegica]